MIKAIFFMIQGFLIPCFIVWSLNQISYLPLAGIYFLSSVFLYVRFQFWLLNEWF